MGGEFKVDMMASRNVRSSLAANSCLYGSPIAACMSWSHTMHTHARIYMHTNPALTSAVPSGLLSSTMTIS